MNNFKKKRTEIVDIFQCTSWSMKGARAKRSGEPLRTHWPRVHGDFL